MIAASYSNADVWAHPPGIGSMINDIIIFIIVIKLFHLRYICTIIYNHVVQNLTRGDYPLHNAHIGNINKAHHKTGNLVYRDN